jgi:hypothetical protein
MVASYRRLFHPKRSPSKHREIICRSRSIVSNSSFPEVPSLRQVFSFLEDNLVYCVENHQVVIVVGQTGCGKTTRMSRFYVLRSTLVIILRNPTIPARERVVCRGQGHSLYTTPSRRSYLCSSPHSLRDGLSGGRGGWLATGRNSVSQF